MKKAARIFLCLLIVMNIIALSGCGDDDPSKSSGQADSGGIADDDPSTSSGQADSGGDDDDSETDDLDCTTLATAENVLHNTEYVLICPASMQESFSSLVDWRNMRGIVAELAVAEDIYDEYEGMDEAAKIKAFIIEKYAGGEGAKYFVLGGDYPVMPVRRSGMSIEDPIETGGGMSDEFATELYFADLTSDWDKNKNGVYGELEDELDMTPEVIVARIPVDNEEEAKSYIEKLKTYEMGGEDDYQKRLMLIGDYAAEFSNNDIYASTAFETLVVEFIPDDFEVTKLYDDYENYPDASENTKETQTAELNRGYNLITHMGHGMETTFAFLDVDEVMALTNTLRPSIFLTTACFSGDFAYDEKDCGGESFILSPGGGVVYIGNTSYGIGFPSITNMMRKFYYYLFQKDMNRIGDCFFRARNNFSTASALTGNTLDRWTQMVWTQLGDAAVDVWLNEPTVANTTVKIGASGDCVAIEVRGENDIPLSGITVTLYSKGDFLYMQKTDGAGNTGFSGVSLSEPVDMTISGNGVKPWYATIQLK